MQIENIYKLQLNEGCENQLKESLSQEIGNTYAELSKINDVNFDELVKDFMSSKYPNGFPDFDGDVIYSKKYWDELVAWAKKERDVEIKGLSNNDFDALLNESMDNALTKEQAFDKLDEITKKGTEEKGSLITIFEDEVKYAKEYLENHNYSYEVSGDDRYEENCWHIEYYKNKELEENMNNENKLVEALSETIKLPNKIIHILSESEVISQAQALKKGSFFTVGYCREMSVATRYALGSVNKKTGEVYPEVHIIKLLEYQGATGLNYAQLKELKRKIEQENATIETPEQVEQALSEMPAEEPQPVNTPPEDYVPREWIVKNVIYSEPRGAKLAFFPLKGSASAEYYISVDGEDYRRTDRAEMAIYMTDSYFRNEFHIDNANIDTVTKGSYKNKATGEFRYNALFINHFYKVHKTGDLIIKTPRQKKVKEPVENTTTEVETNTDTNTDINVDTNVETNVETQKINIEQDDNMKVEKIIKESKENTKSLKDCQKWVDYDLKRYGKISDTTMKFINEAGFVVGRNEEGEFEVVKAAKEEDVVKTKELKESVQNSPYKDVIAKYFDYSFDFEFLDVVADVLDRVDDFSDSDDINSALDGVTETAQEWRILEYYCVPTDANWNEAWEKFVEDIYALCSEIQTM